MKHHKTMVLTCFDWQFEGFLQMFPSPLGLCALVQWIQRVRLLRRRMKATCRPWSLMFQGQTEFCNHTWALLNITFRLFLFYVIFPLDYVSMGSKSLPSKSWWLDPNRNIWKPYLWSFWLHGMDEPTYARMPLPRLPGCWRFLWSPTVASKAGALWRCGGVHCCLLS